MKNDSEIIIKYLHEVESRLPHFTFSETNLPDPSRISPMPTITLTREHLERFRLSYEILLESLAQIVGKDYKTLCSLDLIGYFYKQANKKES